MNKEKSALLTTSLNSLGNTLVMKDKQLVNSILIKTIKELLLVFIFYSVNQFCIAIAGKDFVVVAADTRISLGFNILSREHSKTTRLTDKCVITSSGMVADIETLHKNLITRV